MPYKNPKDLLVDATKLPAAVEAKLPAGAPKISTMLADAAASIPEIPDFPMEIPDLPAPPELPAAPAMPGLALPFTGPAVTRAAVRPTVVTVPEGRREIIPSPAVGVLPEVISRRGI